MELLSNDILNLIFVPKYRIYTNYSLQFKLNINYYYNNHKIVMDQLNYMYTEYYYQKFINKRSGIFIINFIHFIKIKKKYKLT